MGTAEKRLRQAMLEPGRERESSMDGRDGSGRPPPVVVEESVLRPNKRASAVHDRLFDHAMNAFGAVYSLGHAQIGGEAAERVGILARQIALLAEQHDHIAQR